MKKLLLTGVVLSAVIAGPAMAADLGAPVYRRPVVPVAVSSWTGFTAASTADTAGPTPRRRRLHFRISPSQSFPLGR